MENWLLNPSKEVVIVLLILASVRIYLEIINFKFSALPVTKSLAKRNSPKQLERFHKSGFYFSVGYILLFAPQVLLS